MTLASSSLIGLAIGDREIACVQIAGRGARRSVARAARFDVPAGMSLDDAQGLGRALRQFLDEHRMTARRAIVGVPARWLIAEPRELPPASREQALASLRLQAERIALGDDSHLVFDVAGSFGNHKPGHALLVALSQDRLQRLKHLCAAADLTPLAVTATGLVVAQSLKETVEQAVILFSGEGAELVWRTQEGPRAFRHLSGVRAGASAMQTSAGIQPLTTELWRTVAMSAGARSRGLDSVGAGSNLGSGSSVSAGGAIGDASATEFLGDSQRAPGVQRIILLGDAGVSADQCSDLAGRLGRAVECMPGLAALRHLPAAQSLNGQSDRVAADRIWPALALAGAAARGLDELPVNFLRPKLAPPKPARINRTWSLAVLTAALVVLGIGALWWQAVGAEQEQAQLERRLDEMSQGIKRAEAYVAQISYARGFFETRPPVLDALRDLAGAFGREDRIWTTGFSMRETGRGTLHGRAADQQTVRKLADTLKEHPNFAAVSLSETREATAAGERSRDARTEIGFVISFVYIPRETAGATP